MDYVFELDAEEVVYEIDAAGNLDRPKKDRMRAIISPLSAKEANTISREARDALDITRDHPKWSELYLDAFNEVSFRRRVLRLENIRVKGSDGKIREITDPMELYLMKDRNMALIAMDIRVNGLEATGALPEEEAKNSE
jgi:hypothetical protein